MNETKTVRIQRWAELAELLGAPLRHAFYWYPGSMAASAEPQQQLDSKASVHTADIGIVLGTDAGTISFCWRMDGSDEWLGLDPPWASNPALPDYWVVDATESWGQRGLIGAVLTDVLLVTYQVGDARSVIDVVGVVLTFDGSEVGIALGDFDSAQLTNTADTVVVVFSAAAFSDYARRSEWGRHRLLAADDR